MSEFRTDGYSEKGHDHFYGKVAGNATKNSFHGVHMGYVVDDSREQVWVYIPALSALVTDPTKIFTFQGTAPDRQTSDGSPQQANRPGWHPVTIGQASGGDDSHNTGQSIDGRDSHSGETVGSGDIGAAPRNGHVVSVVFTGGDPRKGVITGAVPPPGAGVTVPHGGSAAKSTLTGKAKSPFTDKTSSDACLPYTEKRPSKDDPGGTKRGINVPHANHIIKSGTAKDIHRGGMGAHAKREFPSLVRGQKSNGWNYSRDQNNKDATGQQWKNRGSNVRRHINNGHHLTMDDSPDSSGVILKSGHNAGLVINDSAANPFIHLQTGNGKTYISMDSQGKLEIYGKAGMSIHTENDLNFSSDGDVNFQAGKELNLLANGINLTSNKDYNVAVNGDYSAVYAQASNVNVLGDDKKEVKGNYNLLMKNGAISSKQNYDITTKTRVALKSDMVSIQASTFAVDTTGSILLNCGSSVEPAAPSAPTFAKFKKVSEKSNAPAKTDILQGNPPNQKSKMLPSRVPQHQPDPNSPNNSVTPGTNGGVAPQQQGTGNGSTAAGANSSATQAAPSTTPSTSDGGASNSNYIQSSTVNSADSAQQAIDNSKTGWINASTDPGSDQCVSLVKALAPVGPTSSWTQGDQVMGNQSIQPGTAIATFNSNGDYTNTYGSSHAAIYLGQDANGIQVLDQSVYVPATIRTIPFSKAGPEGGSQFYTISN